MLEILLIRHGRTDWNVSKKVMGRQPIPLNDEGCAQAERLAEYLAGAGLKGIITSPVLRAAETARIIASRQEGVVVEEEEGLAEIDYGEWVNQTFDEVSATDGETWRCYHEDPNDVVLPGGESMKEVVERVADVIRRVRERFKEGRVALVSHADVIKIALLHLLDLGLANVTRFSVDNGAVLLLRFHDGAAPRLVMFNAANGFGKDM